MTAAAWDDAEPVARWRGLPPLPGDRTADVCVVGLGASGLAAVEAALAQGLSVVGLDAGRVAGGAAGRNGGFLLGGAAPFLHDAIARWGDVAVTLYRETLAELDRLTAALPAGTVRRIGSIRLAGWPGAPDEREVDDCRAHAAALREHGIAVEDYDGPLGTGIVLPDDAAVNPAVRALATAQRLVPAAALHEHTAVTAVGPGAVRTTRGTVHAGAVVVAVDGRLPALLPELGERVRTVRLQMLATAAAPPGAVPCPVYGRWGYDYAQQDAAGRVLIGGGRDRFVDEEWTDSVAVTDGVQAHLETAAARLLGAPPAVTHRWAASVGYTGDGRPLCVRVADGPGGAVVAVGGYSGTGNLVGPVAARAALAYALSGTAPPAYLAS
ncbi:Glycine/D-amino acid oxidase [Jatrophihabitans endophyticus]|uniref:Glycine/D-amino acid oxidase n=1 Tax=Jatrophihabitans endophyticus TaxID=1206085 RepID=A0A1M5TCL0_9ACTN|nr:FAD-dependent oxidoreductase [Jatrophihabitans endophyticus]SHH48426.1 Glycine/D-amino acid oxidase [Jatrophihabitans endophyticus]